MGNEVDEAIQGLKVRFSAETDEELAKALGIGRSTISSWRLRGSVPSRYLQRKPSEPSGAFHSSPREWGEEDHAAFALALLRFFRLYGHCFSTYRDFLENGHLAAAHIWGINAEAKDDLLREMNSGPDEKSHPWNASCLLAYDDFQKDENADEPQLSQ